MGICTGCSLTRKSLFSESEILTNWTHFDENLSQFEKCLSLHICSDGTRIVDAYHMATLHNHLVGWLGSQGRHLNQLGLWKRRWTRSAGWGWGEVRGGRDAVRVWSGNGQAGTGQPFNSCQVPLDHNQNSQKQQQAARDPTSQLPNPPVADHILNRLWDVAKHSRGNRAIPWSCTVWEKQVPAGQIGWWHGDLKVRFQTRSEIYICRKKRC